MVLFVSFGLLLALTSGAAFAELVAYYPLDEGGGTNTVDASGNGHDGTINGDPAWITGQYGKALEFTGAPGGHVDLGTWNPSEGTNELSFGLWVKWNGISGEWQGIISKRNSWGPAPAGVMMWFMETNLTTGHLSFGSREGGIISLVQTPLEGEWQHLAVSSDGTTAIIYIDGVEAGSGNFSLGSSTDAGLQFGSGYIGGGGAFNGAVDDVRIFNHALSAREVQTAMIGNLPTAYSPDPADGAMYEATWVTLSWEPGMSAVSHNVYLGDNFDDVNEGTGDTFRINQTDTFYFAGFPSSPYPNGLTLGTTYYWRIDEVNEADADSPWKGDVWSFTVPAKTAYNPNPADGAKFLDPDVRLSWIPGFGAVFHTVYFGDNFADVDAGTGDTAKGSSGKTSFDPGILEPGKIYYWRIDESDGFETQKGDIWSLTIAGTEGGIRADYYQGMNFDTLALSRIDPQINFNWGDPGGPDPAVGDDNFSVRWTGEVEAAFTETYTFYPRTDDGVRLFVDGQLLVDKWVNRSAAENNGEIDLIAGTTYSLVMEYYEDNAGAVAELRWSSPRTPKQIIPQAALTLPVKASSPAPRSGSVDVVQTTDLSWGPGDSAASHEVYFGTDEEAVRNATTASPEFKGTKALGDESYDPGNLAWAATYYWRVDQINPANPDSPWIGNVWNFTTADFLIIDDFEGYDAGENQIWFSWHDGLGYGTPGTADFYAGNGTGAAVGDETTPSFTAETIVHGGNQSMPLAYDNNKQDYSKYSEVELTLTASRDWTDGDVANLSLWFRGYPTSVGSFVEGPIGTYTITASGTDIWDVVGEGTGFHDEFHFAYKTLNGAGSIVARVESVENTDIWAKAGVMIRETLDGGSVHAMMVVTSESGISFQRRPDTGGPSASDTTTDITAPYWVKLERDLSGNFSAYSSDDGANWKKIGLAVPIQMAANVYIGLAVTAHNASATCEAVFSNVTTNGNVTGQWANQDIGIASNEAEPLYVALSNAAGVPAVIVHDDPAAANIDTWTEWVIPLQAFADQGIALTNVDKIAIGLGTKDNITSPGGKGKMFFDDIRLQRPQGSAEE